MGGLHKGRERKNTHNKSSRMGVKKKMSRKKTTLGGRGGETGGR